MRLESLRVLATDGVVIRDGQVLLMERTHAPFEDRWVLPGGLVERGETARTACEREVAEEVGLEVAADRFVGLYDDPDRDPRGNVSAPFRCTPTSDAVAEPLEEARAVEWVDPDDRPPMGFDHDRIVADALERMDGA